MELLIFTDMAPFKEICEFAGKSNQTWKSYLQEISNSTYWTDP